MCEKSWGGRIQGKRPLRRRRGEEKIVEVGFGGVVRFHLAQDGEQLRSDITC
jgi:hypothetical protein